MSIRLNVKTLLSVLPPAAVAALALSGAVQAGCGLRVDEVIGEDRAGLYGDYGDYYGGGYEGTPVASSSSSGASVPTGGPNGGAPSSGGSSSGGGGCDVSNGPATGAVGLLMGVAALAALRRRRAA
jgi:hypothetical protein